MPKTCKRSRNAFRRKISSCKTRFNNTKKNKKETKNKTS